MEAEPIKKRKFSLLSSIGFLNGSQKPAQPEGGKNEFYVGNVQDELKKKKKLLSSIE